MGKNSSEGSNKTWIWIICAIVVIVIVAIFLIKGCGNKEYEIKFNSNGSIVNKVTVKEDGTVTRPSNPTRDGYEFAGWYLNGELFDFNTKITGDITLEARWNEIGEEESKITLGSTKMTLNLNDTEKLSVTASGNASTSGLVWKSSDEKVVTVDSNGNLKALKEGKATITVTTKDGKYSAECVVTVSKKEETTSLKITISGNKTVKVGETITLKANVTPKDAKVVWTSNNNKIATVDENGKVTGVSAGTVTIKGTITDEKGNNKSASVKVTVSKASEPTVKPEDPGTTTPEDPGTITPTDPGTTPSEPEDKGVASTGIKVNVDKEELKINETANITVTLEPSETTDKIKDVKYESNNDNVTVNNNGVITAKKDGKSTITVTVTTNDGKTYTATRDVTVVKATYKVVVKIKRDETTSTLLNVYDVIVTKDGEKVNYTKVMFNGTNIGVLATSNGKNNVLGVNQVSQLTNGGEATITLSDGTVEEHVYVQIIND